LLEWYTMNRLQLMGYMNERKKLFEQLEAGIYFLVNISNGNHASHRIATDGHAYTVKQGQLIDSVLHAYEVAKAKLPKPRPTPLPVRPAQGDNLGPLNKIMGWLLRIESYTLVVIVGLVGFGFLGAAGASFIKEHNRRRTKGGPLVENLADVLIKGFTAALVVFLGMQGGLALLANNDQATPNNNLIFFLALVAAVFSDTAWDWARQRFERTINNKSNE